MRILFVMPYFYPAQAFGGPARVAYDVGKKLTERGHEVTVFTSDAKNWRERLDVQTGEVERMKVYYFRNISMFLVKNSNLFITPGLFNRVRLDLKSFDIIHIHEYATFQNILVHSFAKKYDIPYVLQVHGSLPKIGRKGRKRIYDVFFGRRLLRDASKVVALNQTEAQQYLGMGVPKDKIVVIPNGIDLSEYANLPRKGSFKKKFGIKEEEKIVLYLGRIHKIKGVDILVKAFANVIKKLDDVRLVVVGPDDGYLGELESLIRALKIEDKVLISGPLYGNDKLAAYVDTDLYVLFSRYETFPMTVLEAYACGKPVIASMVGGLNDLVVDGVTGFLVKRGDVKQLAGSILSMLDGNCRAEEMGLSAKQFVKENFTIEEVADRLLCLYRDVALSPPRALTVTR